METKHEHFQPHRPPGPGRPGRIARPQPSPERHLNVIAPGHASTEQHTHAGAEEFIYILSGRGAVLLGSERHEVGAGDFIGFPLHGPAHAMVNDGGEDLVYLVGGNRPAFDVCDYPRLGKRLYVYEGKDGRQYDLVEQEQVGPFRR